MKFISLLSLPVMLYACTSKQQQSPLTNVIENQKTKTQKPEIQIGADIYNLNLVKMYLQEAGPANQKLGMMYFSEALDQFVNKGDNEVAASAFLESIKTYPSANAYYQYGCLLQIEKKHDQALKALEMAESLGFENMGALLYKMACSYSMQHETYDASRYLEYAVQAGYSNLSKIKSDPKLDNLRASGGFAEFLENNFDGITDLEEIDWNAFKNEFPAAKFPLKLKYEDSMLTLDDQQISFDFEKYVTEMRETAKFSREVGQYFYYNYRVVQNPNQTTLIYTVANYVAIPVVTTTYLTTFDNKGKLLDKKIIAGHDTKNNCILESAFTADSTFKIKKYSVSRKTRKDGTSSYGVFVKQDLLGTEELYINYQGIITPKKTDPPI